VIDTPPLTAVSDAFPLLRKVDGVAIVGRVGRNRGACSAHTIDKGAVPASGQAHRPDHSFADRTLARARYRVATMIVTESADGTPVIDLTPEEEAAYLEREVQSAVGMSVPEFIRAYSAGELDDADVAVDEMVGLLRIGQNGHNAAA
jgi:hypothetical protein